MGSNIGEHGKLSPEWYWKKGLHDAHVVGISSQVFRYDSILRASNYVEIKLDASQAMFDTTIKTIKLYNCKVLTPEFDIEGMWWVRDKLYTSGEKYVLEIELRSLKIQCNYVLRFDYCEVER